MPETIEINRGSDWSATLMIATPGEGEGADPVPFDLTGWTAEVYDPTVPALAELITLTVVDAGAGHMTARMEWSEGIPRYPKIGWRLRLSRDGDDRTFPMIWMHLV